MQAREDHERRLREGELERRGFAEERRNAARERARSTSPGGRRRDAGGGGGDSPPSAKFGLAALGFVPPGMVASGTLNALAAGAGGGFGQGGVPSAEPSKRPAPPSAVGVYRHRERVFDFKHPDLHALRQHDLERADRAAAWAAAAAAANATTVADALEEARGGWGEGGSGGGSGGGGGQSPMGGSAGSFDGGGASPAGGAPSGFSRDAFARGVGAVPPLPLPHNIWSERAGGAGASSGGGGGGGASAPLVRVGVPVDELLGTATESAVRAATAARSSRLVPGPRDEGVRLPPAHVFEAADSDANYVIDEAQPVAFQMATRDLPRAAMRAVKSLLHTRPLTVADVHQRRPPFFDAGPPLVSAEYDPPACSFPQTLRRHAGVLSTASKKKAWVGGCVNAFTCSPYTPASLATFDFFAREHAEGWYVTDFSRPSPPPMRPPSRGVTRFAANVGPGSITAREHDRDAERLTQRLLCVPVARAPA
jgi:hypothetical protein